MSQNYADHFQVLNGPEDGAEYAITRPTFHVGTDASCVVAIRLDGSIHRFSALLTAVPDGYRVRRIGSAAVAVNGKRVGKILSRVLKHGDILRVGDTELILRCSAGGLASRSRGLPMQSDAVWAFRLVLENLGATLSWLFHAVFQMRGRMRWFISGLIFGGLTLWYFKPAWATPIIGLGYYVVAWIRYKFYLMTGL